MSSLLVYNLCPAYCLVDFGNGFVPLDRVDDLNGNELGLLDRHMQRAVDEAWKDAVADYDHVPWPKIMISGPGVAPHNAKWRFWIRPVHELRGDQDILLRHERRLWDMRPLTVKKHRSIDEEEAVARVLHWVFWEYYVRLYRECGRTRQVILNTRKDRREPYMPVFDPWTTMHIANMAIPQERPQPKALEAEARRSGSEAADAASQPKPLTGDEMNVLARDYLELHAKHRRVTVKELALHLAGKNPAGTCSTSTVCKLPAYRAYHDELWRRGLKGRNRRPKAVALSAVEHAIAERDAELDRLIHEQAEDYEPSPLEPDPPDRRRRVYGGKRV